MTIEPTIPQGGEDRLRSQQMSLERGSPPTLVPGYEPERFLGVGAYGEVWVAIERNTGRRVAIKFYSHRRGLDWSLLSREVEKLAFLFADRYVVQLIGVGWDADPPYYIMEYLEQGSLADRLTHGPLAAGDAVDLFRDVAIGLVHAHGKGVLHCDLKPANILLDQDDKPRLADFGQSRLSHEQTPALGTLFYMAPEQADLKAVPDARWDVYALGALLYCMLTGAPPYRTAEAVERLERCDSLEERLAEYRRLIRHAPRPADHRLVPGVDRALAEMIDRCLEIEPRRRYPNAQAVLDALDARAARRALRPMKLLGAVGPALVLLVVSLFAWRGFSTAVAESENELRRQALKSNQFAAQYAVRTAAHELERRYDAVEQLATSERWRQAVHDYLPAIEPFLAKLSNPELSADEREALRRQFVEQPARQALQREFESLLPSRMRPPRPANGENGEEGEVASWFFVDPRGTSTVRLPEFVTAQDGQQLTTIGRNYAWRSFFHGAGDDHEADWRPPAGEHVESTRPSAVFRSQATNRWIVAVSTPVYDGDGAERKFLGVVALTVEVGKFVELLGGAEQFAVLVDQREGIHKGVILEHPLFNAFQGKKVPDHFVDYRVSPAELARLDATGYYRDPLADAPEGAAYSRVWLARREAVKVRGEEVHWDIIVQESYQSAIGATLDRLKTRLVLFGLAALAMVLVVVIGLWGFAVRLLNESSPGRAAVATSESTERNTPSPTAGAATEPPRRTAPSAAAGK